jgi:hypothetical protein
MQRSIVPFQTLRRCRCTAWPGRAVSHGLGLDGSAGPRPDGLSQVAQRWADEALRSSGLAETSPCAWKSPSVRWIPICAWRPARRALCAHRRSAVGPHTPGVALCGGCHPLECVPSRHGQGLRPGVGAGGQCGFGGSVDGCRRRPGRSRLGGFALPRARRPRAVGGAGGAQPLQAGQALRHPWSRRRNCSPMAPRYGCKRRARLCHHGGGAGHVCRGRGPNCARQNDEWKNNSGYCAR